MPDEQEPSAEEVERRLNNRTEIARIEARFKAMAVLHGKTDQNLRNLVGNGGTLPDIYRS